MDTLSVAVWVSFIEVDMFKKKKPTPKARYIEIQKGEIAQIMVDSGATINQKTVDAISDYLEEQRGHFAENLQKVIKDWS